MNGWDWPFLTDARAGTVGVLVLGFAASVTGGGPQWFVAALRREVSTKGMWLSVFASALGFLTFGLLVINFFANSITLLAWATVALLVMWIVATIHHAIEARPHVSLTPGRQSA
ncbi:MAG TPA: hypothetical protein VFR33_10760 [Candidatus Dormibacteraeota bacterium]|nr:hypothetical protein [Candidatus Dormibacteraeota bacterium]